MVLHTRAAVTMGSLAGPSRNLKPSVPRSRGAHVAGPDQDYALSLDYFRLPLARRPLEAGAGAYASIVLYDFKDS